MLQTDNKTSVTYTTSRAAHLNRQIVQVIFKTFGIPQVDIFAAKNSAVVIICAPEDGRDQKVLFVDAFSRQWNFKLDNAIPPPGLVARVLHQIYQCSDLSGPKLEKVLVVSAQTETESATTNGENIKIHLIDLLRMYRPPAAVAKLQLQVWQIDGGATFFERV